jgi:hypothetical protein
MHLLRLRLLPPLRRVLLNMPLLIALCYRLPAMKAEVRRQRLLRLQSRLAL